MKEKVTEICQLVPAFAREIDWRRGKTTEGKDYVHYEFKNGSVLDNLAARESSRGKRRHGKRIFYDANHCGKRYLLIYQIFQYIQK